MSSYINIELCERDGELEENRNEKIVSFNSDALILDEDVLPNIESALRGFGYVMDGKHLELVNDER